MNQLTIDFDSSAVEAKMYKALMEMVAKAQEDTERVNQLPYLLNKTQLARDVFNVSAQTLETHIIRRDDFPKRFVGERVLYPKDLVIEWIKMNPATRTKLTGAYSVI